MSLRSKLAVAALGSSTMLSACAPGMEIQETDARLVGGGLGAYIASEASSGNGYATAAGAALGAGFGGMLSGMTQSPCDQNTNVNEDLVTGRITSATRTTNCNQGVAAPNLPGVAWGALQVPGY